MGQRRITLHRLIDPDRHNLISLRQLTMITSDVTIAAALAAVKEGRDVEFKQEFDPGTTRDWCEVLKDIFAIANSGGGVIVFGVDDMGVATSANLSALATFDPAKLTDKIESYTGVQFDDFRIVSEKKNGKTLICLQLGDALVPLIPRKPGTYPATDGKGQERAFSVGVVYVRHGAKSEPANSSDLRKLIDRRVSAERRDLLRSVRRVVFAPAGAAIQIAVTKRSGRGKARSTLSKGTSATPVSITAGPDGTPIRLTSDPNAAAFRLVDPDETHKHRMVDLLKKVNAELNPLGCKLSSYDIHAINAAHGIFGRLEFCYKSKFSPRKYTNDLVIWLIEQMKRDKTFSMLARSKWRRQKRGVSRLSSS